MKDQITTIKPSIMFTYSIYIGVWNETVTTTNREDALDYLKAWSSELRSIRMKGSPVTRLRTSSKLPL